MTTGFELITPLILSHIVVFLFQFRAVDIITISQAVFEFFMARTQKNGANPLGLAPGVSG